MSPMKSKEAKREWYRTANSDHELTGRKITEWEKRAIVKRRNDGVSFIEIARSLGRSYTRVRAHFKKAREGV